MTRPIVTLTPADLQEIAALHGHPIEFNNEAGTAHVVHLDIEYVAEVAS